MAALPEESATTAGAHLVFTDLKAARTARRSVPALSLPLDVNRVDRVLTDSTWTAVGGRIRPADAGGGIVINSYQVDASSGRLARDGFLLAGPPARISAAVG